MPRSFRAAAATAPLAALLVLAPACVERKMMIRSDPPGATVTLDGVDLDAHTPAEVPFDFGGTRAVTLVAPGFKVLETRAVVKDPWYAYFPLDIGAEFLWPFTISDVQTFDYKLEPYRRGPLSDELKAEAKKRLAEIKLRAEEYRAGGSEGPGKVAPPPSPPPAPKSKEDAPKK